MNGNSLYRRLVVCLLLLCASCSFKAPSAILFADADTELVVLNALSKMAQSGVIPLGKNVKYQYELQSPVAVPPDTSLLVDYAFENAPLSGEEDGGEISIELDKGAAFILPVDFAFVCYNKTPQRILYALPLNTGSISSITVHSRSGKKNNETSVRINNMLITPRSYGCVIAEKMIFATPFVHITNAEGKRAVSIQPQENYLFKNAFSLQIEDIKGNALFETGNKRYQYMAAVNNDITFPSSVFNAAEQSVVFEGESESALLIPAAQPASLLEPVPADPGVILVMPQDSWRRENFELYSWDIFPSILIFDMSDFIFQDKMLRRLAFFSEKKGYRGRIVSDEELEGKHGWNAHDYRAQTLADFFNAAKKINFALNAEERELERILLANNIIKKNNDTGLYTAGEGAIVSITRDSNPTVRERLMAHEGFHGIFFIDKDFRDFSAERFAKFNPKAKAFIRSYFDYFSYDTQDNYLVLNEFMAYCLQQPAGQAAEYFGKHLPKSFEEHEWRKSVLPPKDEAAENYPLLAQAFAQEAAAFSSYVKDRWGLAAGRIWRVKPVR